MGSYDAANLTYKGTESEYHSSKFIRIAGHRSKVSNYNLNTSSFEFEAISKKQHANFTILVRPTYECHFMPKYSRTSQK